MIKFLCFFLHFAYSDTILPDEVLDIAAEYDRKKREVQNLENEKRLRLSEIYKLDKETQSLVNKKSDLDKKNVRLNFKLNQTSQKINHAQQELQVLTPELSDRLLLMEHVEKMPWLFALISSLSLVELDHIYSTAIKLNEDQTERIHRYLELHKTLLEENKSLKKTARDILSLKKQIAHDEITIDSLQKQKNQQLKKLNKNLNNEKSKLTHLKRKGRYKIMQSDFKDLESLFATEFYERKGSLKQPVQGELIQGYGINRGLQSDSVELMHKGHFYLTSESKRVSAVAAGLVRSIDTVEGIGKVVVIDHGGRYYTVYGNLEKVTIQLGEVISESEVLGYTGYHHLQLGVGLYFELRHFSEAQDPANWIEPNQTAIASLEKKEL